MTPKALEDMHKGVLPKTQYTLGTRPAEKTPAELGAAQGKKMGEKLGRVILSAFSTPKTPTQKQVEKILKKILAQRIALLRSCGFTDKEIRNRISVEDARCFITDGIAEWEKIRGANA